MKPLPVAGLLGLAALGAQAQVPAHPPGLPSLEPPVVTTTRGLEPAPSLRDTTVITRQELDAAGPLSLGEVLERRAGVELRATGGAGQPQGIFIRGAGSGQTLVLVDGLRVGSAAAGTTSIESIPLAMIERIEVVKGPMSSLYGPQAGGGVIRIFTRGKTVPYLFADAGYGSDNDHSASAGIATADDATNLSLSMGARKVDARSATNPRSPGYVPDRDPHENAFATFHAAQRMWTGETLALEAFVSRSRTRFDAGAPADGSAPDDRSDQTLSGARLSSSAQFAGWWASRLAVGFGLDNLVFHGQNPARFQTRQDQASWINEFAITQGSVVLGAETVRETVQPDAFTHNRRDTNSAFASVHQSLNGQQLEASARRDDVDDFASNNTGSLSYGVDWPSVARISATWARGFRVPTFNDLYGPSLPGYAPNPQLQPERSQSREVALRNPTGGALQWSLIAFDNRIDDLIVYSPSAATVLNVDRARVRGVQAAASATWAKVRWRAALTVQRPRDEVSGLRLQGRAERFGTLDAARAFGPWTAGVSLLASGARFDSGDEAPGTRLPGYAVLDARLRYAFDKHWSAELAVDNLADRRYESAVGYDAPRRAVFLSVRFEAY